MYFTVPPNPIYLLSMGVNVAQLRTDFLAGKNDFLTEITEKHSRYCVSYMRREHQCSEDQAKDLFTECFAL